MVISGNLVQKTNAPEPMPITLAGIVILVSWSQPLKAPLPIRATFRPISEFGQPTVGVHVSERFITDIRHAVRDDDAGNGGSASKCVMFNADDGQVINRLRDDNGTARTGVSGDGDSAVNGCEEELGLHCGGQLRRSK